MRENPKILVTHYRDETAITLGLLKAVEVNSKLTQRSVAGDLGIALGLANAYLKRCIRKGYVKVTQAPANRYKYYLTPKGFAEKTRLTTEYLAISFNFYRGARQQCSKIFAHCLANDWRRVMLAGAGDLAEIATLCATDLDLALLGVFDTDYEEEVCAGLRVVREIRSTDEFDAIIVTDLAQGQAVFDYLSRVLSEERILTPGLLNVTRLRPDSAV